MIQIIPLIIFVIMIIIVIMSGRALVQGAICCMTISQPFQFTVFQLFGVFTSKDFEVNLKSPTNHDIYIGGTGYNLHSAKGVAVETGCSDLRGVIYYFTT